MVHNYKSFIDPTFKTHHQLKGLFRLFLQSTINLRDLVTRKVTDVLIFNVVTCCHFTSLNSLFYLFVISQQHECFSTFHCVSFNTCFDTYIGEVIVD